MMPPYLDKVLIFFDNSRTIITLKMEVGKMRVRRLRFLAVVLLLFTIVTCVTSQEKARTKLDEMNIAYDEDSFVQKASEGDVQAVENFMIAGTDPNVTDEKGNTALIAAAKKGHQEIVTILLEKGADIESRDSKFGATPLIWAAIRGQTDTVKLLLQKGAAISAVEEKNGMNAIILAAIKGNNEIIEVLLENGADVSAGDKDGRTPLMWAAHHDHTNTVTFLLDKGADLEAKDSKAGVNALMSAATTNSVETIKVLLDHGAEIDARADDGKTALILAAFLGRAGQLRFF